MICLLFVSPAFSHFCFRQMSISSSDTRSPGLLQQRAGDHGAIAGCARWILPRPPGALRVPRGVAWCVACAAGARDDPRRADCHGADGAGHGQPQGLGGAAVAAGIACVAWRNSKQRIHTVPIANGKRSLMGCVPICAHTFLNLFFSQLDQRMTIGTWIFGKSHGFPRQTNGVMLRRGSVHLAEPGASAHQ